MSSYCDIAPGHPFHGPYHGGEYGFPSRDDKVLFERLILRRLAGNVQGQVLVTLGFSFIIADLCLMIWTGDPWTVPAPAELRPPIRVAGFAFPTFRLVVLGISFFTFQKIALLADAY